MPTTEDANNYFGSLAEHVHTSLAKHGPKFAFSIVFWFRGEPDNVKGMAIMTPPDAQREQREALLRASSVSKLPGAIEMHGLDIEGRVHFYEQDYYVLSNFSAFRILWEGQSFPTLEHAYHWEKFRAPAHESSCRGIRAQIMSAISAHEAFKLAEKYKPYRRADWDEVKVGIMQALLRAKVEQHEYVRRKLLATGDRELVENSWRDDFWGWGPNRDGKNVLGRLWMAVRAELRGEPVTAFEV